MHTHSKARKNEQFMFQKQVLKSSLFISPAKVHRWFSSRILTCCSGGLGSFPGQCSQFVLLGFPSCSDGKESACNAGDRGSIPEPERSPG